VKTCADVCHWIRLLGKEYASYVEAFEKDDVDGYWLLHHVDDTKLLKYGIKNSDHRQVILNNLEQLKKSGETEVPTEEK
jgi:hypothetical protein